MTKSEAAKLVAALLAAFPGVRANDGTSMIYERMLGDLDYASANAAIERLLAGARFMPTIGEVRESALALTVGERKPGGEAWGSVTKAIGREGVNRTPGVDFMFADPITARCVAALGWEEMCNSELQAADRARFIDLYDQLAAQERRKQLSDALPAMQTFRAVESERRQQIENKTGETPVADALCKVLSISTGEESS